MALVIFHSGTTTFSEGNVTQNRAQGISRNSPIAWIHPTLKWT